MSLLLLLVASALVAAQLLVPWRFVLVPLLVAACHVPAVVIFPPSISIIRIVLLACLLRAVIASGVAPKLQHPLDWWMVAWAFVLVVTGFGHGAVDGNPLTLRLGLVFELGGTYVCARAYLKKPSDIVEFSKHLALVLVPLAVLMLLEKATGQSGYEMLGAAGTAIRHGQVRAAGPFAGAILAGTVGATVLPLMRPSFRNRRVYSLLGAVACCTIVYASGSSGPMLTLVFAAGALVLWRWRSVTPWIRIGVIACAVLLHLVMNDPVWYLMARIDLGVASVAFHRAELITQALDHIEEWWLVGTDHTRHWIAYGVPWSEHHVDITNYFLKMGILGGIPLMLTFIGLLVVAFRLLGSSMRALRAARDPAELVLWCVGASLAALCFAFIGVAPYDQSLVVFWLIIGSVPGIALPPMRHE